MNAERISMKCGGDYHYHGTTNSWTYYILSEIGQGCRIWQKIRIDVKPMLPRSEWAHTFHRLATQTSLSKQVLSTEAAFSACLTWHWPDHHWQCNWRVTWTSLRMCVWAEVDISSNYCDNIQPYDKRRFSFCQMWHDFKIIFLEMTTNSNFSLSQDSAAAYWCDIWVLLKIFFSFQQWENLKIQ